MDIRESLFNAAPVLSSATGVAVVLVFVRLLRERTAYAFAFFTGLTGAIATILVGAWLYTGVMAAVTAGAAYLWWKHRNDDDDDETKRRRRRVTSKLRSHLPKPQAFARPVPAQG